MDDLLKRSGKDPDIVYQDDNIVVCIKKPGQLSEKGRPGSLPDMLEKYYSEKGSIVEIFPVHRLDKDVGGLMVFAKDKKTAGDLSSMISSGLMKKEYEAIVHGIPEPPKGEMRDFLYHDVAKNRSYTVKTMRKGVKEAILSYEVMEEFTEEGETYSKVNIVLKTGRTHQIRCQFASRKMPLAGDRRYGAKDERKNIALVSCGLSFRHPATGKEMDFHIDNEGPQLTEG